MISEGLAREERTTYYVVLLATFVMLLGSETGETDVVLGTYVTNRNRAEPQNVGLFSSFGLAYGRNAWGLSMTFAEHQEDHRCRALFDAGIYRPAGVHRMVDRLRRLLDVVSRHPDFSNDALLAMSAQRGYSAVKLWETPPGFCS